MAAASHFRVLVVDDNAINQKIVSIVLREIGLTADVASNGAEALAVHRSKPYDLILMDVHMPVMDGWEATRYIRLIPGRQPVIVGLTADVLDNAREKCLKVGMDDYLSKPFTRGQLLTLVKVVHERRLRADELCEVT